MSPELPLAGLGPPADEHRKLKDWAFCRAFTFEDQVRGSSAAALRALQHGSWRTSGPSRWLGWLPLLGGLFRDGARRADALHVMMLTGDNIASARSIAGTHALRL